MKYYRNIFLCNYRETIVMVNPYSVEHNHDVADRIMKEFNNIWDIFIECYQLVVGLSLASCYIFKWVSIKYLILLYVIWLIGTVIYMVIIYRILGSLNFSKINQRDIRKWKVYKRTKFVCLFITYSIILSLELFGVILCH